MNIGSEINEELYKRVWENMFCECRKTISDQTTSFTQCKAYDSLGFLIDDTLRGHIALEINKNIMQIKL
jgi:hypothetical protein